MRISLTLLTLTLVALVLQPTWANPKPFTFNIGVGGDILYGGSSNGGNSDENSSSNEAADVGGYDTYASAGLVSSFIENFQQIGERVSANVQGAVHQTIGFLTNTINTFLTNLDRELQATVSHVKRASLLVVQDQLKELNADIKGAEQHAIELRDQWNIEIGRQAGVVLQYLNIWASEQLDIVSKATSGNEQSIAAAQTVVNEYVKRYIKVLSACSDDIQTQLQDYDQQLKNIFEQYEPVIDALRDQVDVCLNGRDTNAVGRKCQRQFDVQLANIKKFPSHIDKLTVTEVELLNSREDFQNCNLQTLFNFGLEKQDGEEKIVEIVESFNAAQSGNDGDSGAGQGGDVSQGGDGSASHGTILRSNVNVVITNLDSELQSTVSHVKRTALLEVQNQLKELNANIKGAEQHAIELRDQWNIEIGRQAGVVLQYFNIWANGQIVIVSKATSGNEQSIAAAQTIVNEYVKRYVKVLSSCSDEIHTKLQDYDQQLQNIFEQYEPVVDALSEQVDICLNGRDTNAVGRKCQRQFDVQLAQIKKFPSDINKLTITEVQLLNSREDLQNCKVQTLLNFDLDKNDVEQKLSKL